jgi:hypothetical protein
MTLLREHMEISEFVGRGAVVLKLSEGVIDPDATPQSYAVTEMPIASTEFSRTFT